MGVWEAMKCPECKFENRLNQEAESSLNSVVCVTCVSAQMMPGGAKAASNEEGEVSHGQG